MWVPLMPPQTRWIGGVRALYWPSVGVPRGALLFVPGNPGVCEYYAEFLSHLHALLRGRCVIVCKGSPGHDETRHAPPPTGRYAWLGHAWTYYGLPDQVASQQLAFEELRAELPAGAPLVLAGHSMGAYVATQLLCKYADDVQGMQLLFPTISHIAKAPQARFTRLWMAPPLLFVVHWLVVCLACLPAHWHYMLVRALTMQPPAYARMTSEFLRRPGAVLTALRTYADEEALITDIPDELRQVLQRRKIPVRAYWGRGDSVRMHYLCRIHGRHRGTGYTRRRSWGCNHGPCLRTCTAVSARTSLRRTSRPFLRQSVRWACRTPFACVRDVRLTRPGDSVAVARICAHWLEQDFGW